MQRTPPYFNGRELKTESIWGPRMPVPGALKPDPHISTAVSSGPKVYGGQKVVKSDQRIWTSFAIFCDFSRFSTRGHPLLTCPKHCVCQQKKKSCWHGQRFWRSKSPCLESKFHTLSFFFATPRKKLSIFRVVRGLTGKVYRERGCNPTFPAPVFRMTWVAQGKLPQIIYVCRY